ncbi:hypothetical protein QTP88_029730 [Uroleucon formosanum]
MGNSAFGNWQTAVGKLAIQSVFAKVRKYLDESFDSSDYSDQDDSDFDPDFSLQSLRQDSLSRAGPSHTNTGSDTSNESFEVSSSDTDNNDNNNANNNGNDDQWYENWEDIPDFQFDNSMSGIKLNIPDSAKDNPLEIFDMLWTREITDIIVSSTNNYGVKLTSQSRPHKKNCRIAEFKKVDAEEINKFLAICLLSGSIKFSVIRDMFSYNPLYYHPIIPRTMSGRRFEQILRCFSVEYYETEKVNSKNDPIKKIEPIFKKLINNFQLAYIPYECLSLDESLLLHRGRLLFRQYMRLKKARHGIKFFELCTPDGFVLNMEMYKGKREEIQVGSTSKINSLVFRIWKLFLIKGIQCLWIIIIIRGLSQK